MAERPIKAERKNTDMTVGVLKTLGTFLVFLLVQVLVLNHVHLFDSATPLLYIYMVLLFPRNYPKWALLVWAFAMGLGVDMFSNTPGVAAASLTLVALLRPYLLELFIQRESADDLVPSMKVLGFSRYLFFAFLIIFIYCLTFFSLEAFSFFNWIQWALCVGGSTLLTLLLVMVLDNLRR